MFDTVTAISPHYVVGGNNPYGLPNDVENVLTGYCCSEYVKITSISATMKLTYAISTSAKFVSVPHAWSGGYDTSEAVSNVHMSKPTTDTGKASTGTDNDVQLW